MSYVARIDAYRGEAKLRSFFAKLGNLVERGIRAQQGMVDIVGHIRRHGVAVPALNNTVGPQVDKLAQ